MNEYIVFDRYIGRQKQYFAQRCPTKYPEKLKCKQSFDLYLYWLDVVSLSESPGRSRTNTILRGQIGLLLKQKHYFSLKCDIYRYLHI